MENFQEYYWQIAWTVMALIVSTLIKWVLRRFLRLFAAKKQLALIRVAHVMKTANIFITLVVIFVLGFIWNLSLEGFTIYLASFFTVAGIGLFAAWSILSNITAAVILFFYFPHKIGSKIKILDGDNSVTGEILDITLFTVHIKSDLGENVFLPNNIFIQRTTVLLG